MLSDCAIGGSTNSDLAGFLNQWPGAESNCRHAASISFVVTPNRGRDSTSPPQSRYDSNRVRTPRKVVSLLVPYRLNVDHHTWLAGLDFDDVRVARVPHFNSDSNRVRTRHGSDLRQGDGRGLWGQLRPGTSRGIDYHADQPS